MSLSLSWQHRSNLLRRVRSLLLSILVGRDQRSSWLVVPLDGNLRQELVGADHARWHGQFPCRGCVVVLRDSSPSCVCELLLTCFRRSYELKHLQRGTGLACNGVVSDHSTWLSCSEWNQHTSDWCSLSFSGVDALVAGVWVPAPSVRPLRQRSGHVVSQEAPSFHRKFLSYQLFRLARNSPLPQKLESKEEVSESHVPDPGSFYTNLR